MLPLSERHRPRRLEEMVGNTAALRQLRAWANQWGPERPPPRFRAALLEGPPGVGKTTAAAAIAREMGWSLVEMNASEARNREAIEQVAGRAALTQTIGDREEFVPARAGGRTLILLDEADCLSGRVAEERPAPTPIGWVEFLRRRYGRIEELNARWGLGSTGAPAPYPAWSEVPATPGRGAISRWPAVQPDLREWRASSVRIDHSDRGGLAAIARLVRTSRQPILLTVNDLQPLVRYSPVFRQGVRHIPFGPVGSAELRDHLARIVVREGRVLAPEILDLIVRRSEGDVRAALNDLEAIGPVAEVPLQRALLAGGRDHASEFATFVHEVLSIPRYRRSTEIRDRLDASPEDLLPWIEETLPGASIDAGRRYRAYGRLGKAELCLARARRSRHYGLWSYAGELMTGGVAGALDRPPGAAPFEVGFPAFLSAMGRSRMVRARRQQTLAAVAPSLHLSRRKASESMLPLLFELFDPARPGFSDPPRRAARRALIRAVRWGEEEVGFLLGTEPDSELVHRECDESEGAPRPVRPPAMPPPSEPAPPAAAPAPALPPEPSPETGAEPGTPPPPGRATRQRRLADF